MTQGDWTSEYRTLYERRCPREPWEKDQESRRIPDLLEVSHGVYELVATASTIAQ